MKVFPDDLLYSREHAWVRLDGNLATIGITDYAQEKLGEALSIELPEVDTSVEKDEPFGVVESARNLIDLIAPLSGEIISINEDIVDDIGIINSDPHDTGWMMVIDIAEPSELDDLLDLKGYQDFIAQEMEID
ncbi:MAG: glycine cleavage system protein GcvH [Deltaproteobacteria bacterium]|nr:glycine cleavage system protein GcvH [Deltaproteobacteria bacterium]